MEQEVSVSTSKDPSPWERHYLHSRLQDEKDKIRNFCDSEADNKQLPTIALVASGGGFRAMICFMGMFKAISDMGLLSAVRYSAVLSGSTWMLGTYLAWLKDNENKDLLSFIVYVKQMIARDLGDDFLKSVEDLIEQLVEKKLHREDLQPADIWGMFVVTRIMGDMEGAELDLSYLDIRKVLGKRNDLPFPIFTAGMDVGKDKEYDWLEVNPYTVCSDSMGGAVPTSYFNNKFKEGKLDCDPTPEERLYDFLGVFGSAYSLDPKDIEHHVKEEIVQKLAEVAIDLGLGDVRLFKSEFKNYTFKMEGLPLEQKKEIVYFDAGISMDLPFPPLFEKFRNIDVFIVCDASGNEIKHPLQAIEDVCEYAKKNDIPFPGYEKRVSFQVTVSEQVYVNYVYNLEQSDIGGIGGEKTPTIVQFVNPNMFPTIKFQYDDDEFQKLYGTFRKMVKRSEDMIRKAIKGKIGNNTKDPDWITEDVQPPKYPEAPIQNWTVFGFLHNHRGLRFIRKALIFASLGVLYVCLHK